MSDVKIIQDLMLKHGFIKKKAEIERFIDRGFVDASMKGPAAN